MARRLLSRLEQVSDRLGRAKLMATGPVVSGVMSFLTVYNSGFVYAGALGHTLAVVDSWCDRKTGRQGSPVSLFCLAGATGVGPAT